MFYYGISTKTSEKDLKIPNLQALTLGRIIKMTLYIFDNLCYNNVSARYTSTGICTHPEQQIHSCQNIGSQFLISNQKFNVTLKHCEGMEWTKDKVVEYSCLGDWVVGKNQYFAVANTKESRIDEKFRCFMKNRDDDYFLGQSNTPECNHIKTVEQVRIVLEKVPSEGS